MTFVDIGPYYFNIFGEKRGFLYWRNIVPSLLFDIFKTEKEFSTIFGDIRSLKFLRLWADFEVIENLTPNFADL